jgi:hypothetical protein
VKALRCQISDEMELDGGILSAALLFRRLAGESRVDCSTKVETRDAFRYEVFNLVRKSFEVEASNLTKSDNSLAAATAA